MNEKINLDDLYNKNNTHLKKKKVYDKILKRAQKIKTTTRNKIILFCTYVIPEFITGLPRYDIQICTDYVMEKLIDNGFMVKYTHPNLMFIS